ncbi:MAG: hypothetical protein FD123_4297 [Bacteroidetes bacterium]|nr:MAG: hypothetical protein FD123_4297 [Bacteroidota bacterium]
MRKGTQVIIVVSICLFLSLAFIYFILWPTYNLKKTADTLDSLSAAMSLRKNQDTAFNSKTPASAKKTWEKANIIKKRCDSLGEYINKLKDSLAFDKNGDSISPSDIAHPTRFLYDQGRASVLRKRIESYKKHLASVIIDSTARRELNQLLSTNDLLKDSKTVSWEYFHFYHITALVARTQLGKFENAIRKAEGIAVNDLFDQMPDSDFKFDKLEPHQIAPSSTILKGDSGS